ncbi:MAG: hypothetical protein HY231_11525 [Acidobacteria bacterium]|nr:hypothetical protein [Acidobacteriota bacterium]
MHSPQQAHASMHIKGGLLRARFLYIVLNHGVEGWAKILARLSEADHDALAEIDIDNWYALDLLDRLDHAIADELGGDSEALFTTLGEFSATSSLSGAFSSLLDSDIHAFLTQTALIHRSYQDFGSATYEALSANSGLLKINYADAPTVSYCTSGTAYFRRAIELCGAENARVTHTRCAGRGDAVCEFYATWQ